MHILFAGGGTAGHINPALAIAGHIKNKHADAVISYIGTQHGLEAKLVPQAGYAFYTIEVAGFQRSLKPSALKRNARALLQVFRASRQARTLLIRLKPDIVVGTGGYVSGPVVREAVKLGIKTAIHEQNAFPGVTTKMLAGKVDLVMLAMEAARERLHARHAPVLTGNPVRQAMLRSDRAAARAQLRLDNRPMILSFGGSLGARPVNEAVTKLIEWHYPTGLYYHIHAAGRSGYEAMVKNLRQAGVDPDCETVQVRDYIHNMDVLLAAADLVICRAGAITLSELQVCGKASILIPSPYVAENHQFHNAMTLKKRGAALLIEEKDLTGPSLIEQVKAVLDDKNRLHKMERAAKSMAIDDANARIYQALLELYTNYMK